MLASCWPSRRVTAEMPCNRAFSCAFPPRSSATMRSRGDTRNGGKSAEIRNFLRGLRGTPESGCRSRRTLSRHRNLGSRGSGALSRAVQERGRYVPESRSGRDREGCLTSRRRVIGALRKTHESDVHSAAERASAAPRLRRIATIAASHRRVRPHAFSNAGIRFCLRARSPIRRERAVMRTQSARPRSALSGMCMLSVYLPRGNSLERKPVDGGREIPEGAVWLDLVTPTVQEEKQEIEVTSRLYVENGARYMTATLMCQSDTEAPKTTAVTFILAGHRLITVRYDEPRPFTIVGAKLGRVCSPTVTGEAVMMDLLDAVIDRAADILERIGADVDQVSHDIFEPESSAGMRSRSYNDILRTIGRKGEI